MILGTCTLDVPLDLLCLRAVSTVVECQGSAMPLTRRKEQILIAMKGVKFLMTDGGTEVPCTASHEVLAQKFGSNGERDQDEKAFRDNRMAIEQAASDKYDAGWTEPHVDPKVMITARDMASPLSRKI
jgi:Protein of unknown function (DUF1488)